MNRLFFAGIFLVIGLMGVTASAADVTVEPPDSCGICTMNRTSVARSRVLIVYDDGTTAGFCSITCAAGELKKTGYKLIKSLKVADYLTSGLIDAKAAVWVVGGDVPGIMTTQPKWAFAQDRDAQEFIKQHGGKVASLDQVMNAAYEEATDTPV